MFLYNLIETNSSSKCIKTTKNYTVMKKNYTSIRKLIPIIILALFALILISACGPVKKNATGLEDEIFVVADSVEFEELEASLLQVFSKIIYTPQPEKLFRLTRKSINQIESLKKKKNVIIAAPLNSGSLTSNYINGLLNPEVKKIVEQDSAYVFNKYDLWANDQLVMVLTSPTIEQLNKNILNGHENLMHNFQTISDKRLFKSLYNAKYERKDLEAQILRDHGWILYVQADYLLAMNKPEDNFVWLRRAVNTDMERWIFAYYIENASPVYLNADSIQVIRNRVTEKYYRSSDNQSFVEISDDYKTTNEVNFLGRYALLTQGLWRMSDKTMGGPFLSYTFYDEDTKRIYMLDGSLYAPKYEKKSIIQQLDVTLSSFMTKKDMSEEKIEELMDELD